MRAKPLKKNKEAVADLAKIPPPQADESEKIILDAMLSHGKARERALTLLRSEHFFHPSRQQFFELLSQDRSKNKAIKPLQKAADSIWAKEKAEFHAARVKDAHLRRKLLGIAMGIAHNAQCGMYEARELIRQASNALEALENRIEKEACVI